MVGNPNPFNPSLPLENGYTLTEGERRYNSYIKNISILMDQLRDRAEAKLGELHSSVLGKKYIAFEEKARESGIELRNYVAFLELIGENNEPYSEKSQLDLPEDSPYNVKKFIINLTKEFFTEQEIYREEIVRILRTLAHKIEEIFPGEGIIKAHDLQSLLFGKMTDECPQELQNYASWHGLSGSSIDKNNVSELPKMELDFPAPYNIKTFFLKLMEKLDKSEDKLKFISELEEKFKNNETMEAINTFLES